MSIKREDLLDSRLGGNKIYKLYGHLQAARKLFSQSSNIKLASYGGAWSNHIYALAAMGESLKLPTMGVIRGEPSAELSAMLQDVLQMGMHLEFVSRAEYRDRANAEGARLRTDLDERYGRHYWIPEGGGGVEGARHCGAMLVGILNQANRPVDVISHACGTGASLAGLIAAASAEIQVLGFSVLKSMFSLDDEVRILIEELKTGCSSTKESPQWHIDHDSHCGGYAKLPEYLREFICRFEDSSGIPLDPVYTAKLLYGLTRLAEKNTWKPGTHIVAIHSGGLQGRRGWPCLSP